MLNGSFTPDSPILLKPGSLRLLWKGQPNMPGPTLELKDDQTGFFIYAGRLYRGTPAYRILVAYDPKPMPENAVVSSGNVQGYGIEMIHTPEGGFPLGDPKETAPDYYRYRTTPYGEGAGESAKCPYSTAQPIGAAHTRTVYCGTDHLPRSTSGIDGRRTGSGKNCH